MNKEIRVRIAPSPTGNLHVGTARAALFNYLFAKNQGGKFILRIEDTDLERSSEEFEKNIYDSLCAIGLNWDEGPDIGGEYAPYRQSERLHLYEKHAKTLLEKGFAYYCDCTNEDIDREREEAKKSNKPYVYSGKCKNLNKEKGENSVLRFKVEPNKTIEFKDLSKGDLEFDSSLIGDFVIMKSNGTPTYNFAVVVDDVLMKISHIIRGEDHISNTAKQILIYEALGEDLPEFAHVGMILAPDRTKLSKRHGATAVSEFIEQGYLPEAFVNFISLLGWSAPDGQEIMSIDTIIEKFSIERISPSSTIFEMDKLNWINGQYIKKMDIKELTNRIKPYLAWYDLSKYTEDELEEMVAALREPLTVLSDIKNDAEYFFELNIPEEIQKDILSTEDSQKVLKEFLGFIDEIDFSNAEAINEKLAEFRTQMKPLKPKTTMWTIRASLTGRVRGADLATVMKLLKKDIAQARIKDSLKNTL